MSITVSQQLNHINENNYDDDITVTNVPKGHFAAVVSVLISPGETTRSVTVDLLPLEQSDGGTQTVNTGLYVRQPDENDVRVTVLDNRKEVAENMTSYS